MHEHDRLSTGISGLDEVLGSGLLRERAYMVTGGAGTGKTIVGLHFLTAGVEAGEDVLFVAFEEDPADLAADAAGLGFDTSEITFLDLSPDADRFVADESIDGAVAHVRALDTAGIAAIVTHLGEHYDDPADARADTEESYSGGVERAVEIHDAVDYGLAGAIISEDYRQLNYYRDEAGVGLASANLPCIGAEVQLPFGDLGKSGKVAPSAREVIEAVTERTAWTLNNARDIEMAQGLSAELQFGE